jgi:hypothetical protein
VQSPAHPFVRMLLAQQSQCADALQDVIALPVGLHSIMNCRDRYGGEWLMQFPALTAMIWLRRDLGYRTVGPARLIPITVLLVVASVLAIPSNADARPVDLLVFALLTFALGVYQRVRRWIQLDQKIRQHSYYIGTSPFDFRWLPVFFRRNRRIPRFVDPLVVMLIGLAVFQISRSLGLWLAISAISLRTFEYTVFQRERKLSLDIMDGMILSERESQIVEEFEATSGWHQHKDASGITTGLSGDIERQITISVKQRKVKNNKNTINFRCQFYFRCITLEKIRGRLEPGVAKIESA